MDTNAYYRSTNIDKVFAYFIMQGILLGHLILPAPAVYVIRDDVRSNI
jgi:hypothetical protein